MKSLFWPVGVALAFGAVTNAQITVPLPDRTLVKLVPDYARPKVYGLNRGNGAAPGTLLALNSSNGAVLAEISLGLNPTDMAGAPAGEALYVINTGARTLMKVDLSTFGVTETRSFNMLQQSSSVMGPFEDVTAASPTANLWVPGFRAWFLQLRSMPYPVTHSSVVRVCHWLSYPRVRRNVGHARINRVAREMSQVDDADPASAQAQVKAPLG